MSKVTIGSVMGYAMECNFQEFDLTEIQEVLNSLSVVDVHDLAHAELLQQQSLRGADIISEYLAQIVKTVSFLEAKVSSVKNKASLDYTSADGSKVTAEMRKWAGESSPDVLDIQMRLSAAKGTKIYLEKKYDILIKSHHHYKDISSGLRKTILGYTSPL